MVTASASAAPEIATILALAIAATWIADRLRIPSIVLLLATGIAAGPVLGFVDPDALFGELLPSLSSLAVGVILFEGGLSLRFREIRNHARVVWLYVTVGVAVTWATGAIAALYLLDAPLPMAVLLGAVLVVSGPTVIAPLIQTVRPARRIAAILKWESIVIDPIGALIAVVVFEVVLVGAYDSDATPGRHMALFVIAGVGAALVFVWPLALAVRRHLIPERLIPLVGVGAAVVAFAAADTLAPESGLLATTIMGIVLANDRTLRTEPIIEFSELLQPLLVGVLFIVLSARLTSDQLASISVGVVGLIAALVFVARPVATLLATWRSGLSSNERVFLGSVAPRGIVAAAVASVFSIELEEAGVAGAALITPVTFAVIIGTVLVYGFSAKPLARRLELSQPVGQGALIVDAGVVGRELARALSEIDLPVTLVSPNRADEVTARLLGYRTHYGSAIAESLFDEVDMSGLGRLLVATPDDGVNTLVARHLTHLFGPGETYQLPADESGPGIRESIDEIGGRTLFDKDLTHDLLTQIIEAGGQIRASKMSPVFDATDLHEQLGEAAWILFVVANGKLRVATDDAPLEVGELPTGSTVLSIAKVEDS